MAVVMAGCRDMHRIDTAFYWTGAVLLTIVKQRFKQNRDVDSDEQTSK
jgi:hypothetical protein